MFGACLAHRAIPEGREARMIRVAVLGATGYTGGELLRLLFAHPNVSVVFASSESSAGMPVANTVPALRTNSKAKGLLLQELAELGPVDIVFSCLPCGLLPEKLAFVEARAARIINLAGDYRLRSRGDIEKHTETYFVPELCAVTPTTKLLSLPGCMAAATLYALYPLVRNKLIEVDVIADAKTGSSGGGKDHGHRHRPEIVDALHRFTGTRLDLQFSTHSLDLPRGVLVATYSKLKPGVTSLDVKRAYVQAYVKSSFVHYLTGGNRLALPMIKTVAQTNAVEVGTSIEGRNCVTVATLDNLAKGAAGQAVQAFNRLMGVAEKTAETEEHL